MALLPHQASANDCPLLTIVARRAAGSADLEFVPPQAQGQGTQAAGACRLSLLRSPRTDADVTRLLDWFFAHQAAADGGAETAERVRRPRRGGFHSRRLLPQLAGGGRVIDIHALECDDEVIAIFAGVDDGHRFSMMFNTYTMSGSAKYSPGLILMRDIDRPLRRARLSRARPRHRIGRIQAAVLQGRRADLRQLYSAQPARPAGRAAAMSGVNRAKHLVKHNPRAVRAGAKAARRSVVIS